MQDTRDEQTYSLAEIDAAFAQLPLPLFSARGGTCSQTGQAMSRADAGVALMRLLLDSKHDEPAKTD